MDSQVLSSAFSFLSIIVAVVGTAMMLGETPSRGAYRLLISALLFFLSGYVFFAHGVIALVGLLFFATGIFPVLFFLATRAVENSVRHKSGCSDDPATHVKRMSLSETYRVMINGPSEVFAQRSGR